MVVENSHSILIKIIQGGIAVTMKLKCQRKVFNIKTFPAAERYVFKQRVPSAVYHDEADSNPIL